MEIRRNRKRKNKNIKKLTALIAAVMAVAVPFTGFTAQKLITASAATQAVVTKAESRIGSRYVYGACHSYAQLKNRNQRAFDCSGLVNWSYYQAGSSIGINTSSSLGRKGTRVSYSSLKPGDIVLFSGHAGVYIGNNKMVHAPNRRSRVKVTSLNGYWRRHFRSGRRIITASYVRKANQKTLKKTSVTYTRKRKYTAGTYRMMIAMNVRKGASINSGLCGFIRKGQTVKVKRTYGKWGQIKYKGKTRYVSLKYAKKIK